MHYPTPFHCYVIVTYEPLELLHSEHAKSFCYRNLPFNHVSLPGSFLVGNDGRVYEGVGWTIQGMHTQGYNNVSLGLAFFGNNLGNGHPSGPPPRNCLHCLPSPTLVFSAYIMLFSDDGPSLEVLFSLGFCDGAFWEFSFSPLVCTPMRLLKPPLILLKLIVTAITLRV